MSPDTWSEIDDIHLEDMVSRLPDHLYHYRSLKGERREWVKEAIVDSKLYFARPSEFNDPLDCKIPPIFDSSRLKIENHWRKYVKRKFPGDRLRNHKKTIQQMAKNSKTEDGQHKLIENVFESLEKNGMLCLSKTPISILMWSYYANGHQGICFRFRITPKYLISIAEKLFPLEVNYSDKFPEINYYKAGTHDFIRTIIGTKAKAWEHEQEWRIILPLTTGKVSFPSAMLDGIIFGMRTDKEDEVTIGKWLDSRGIPIERLRVINKPRSFELNIYSE